MQGRRSGEAVRHEPGLAAVKYEGVQAVCGFQSVQPVTEPLHGTMIGHIDHVALATPPVDQARPAVRTFDEVPTSNTLSGSLGLGVHERMHRKQNTQAHLPQVLHQRDRVGEVGGVEDQIPLYTSPAVVDHHLPAPRQRGAPLQEPAPRDPVPEGLDALLGLVRGGAHLRAPHGLLEHGGVRDPVGVGWGVHWERDCSDHLKNRQHRQDIRRST
mmetsp:Transcript_37071/g.97122  ORF Transcript_37071/g.97122 Transcript_37071/m.97122 type:complete len:214 (+) Transcript_37071:642-1283(+)